LAGGLTLAWMWPPPLHCTYIGNQGAAYFTGRWGNSTPSTSQVILFREIVALFASTTHFYKNLIYEHTMFRYDWHRDASGPPAMTIADQHSYKDDLPPYGHLLHFALRLEDVWTNEVISRLGTELSAGRTLSFPCRKSTFTEMLAGVASRNDMREIRLNQSQVEFVYDDRTDSLAIRELGSFQAKRGVLKFEQHDATWFSRQGKFRIDYQHLGNAKAFLYYLAMAVSAQ
ncbi:MAG TPA: hypothetical protein VMP01_18385, partial [Pirellulaceae bacterium]|nr:hypothetical protein [Pirellulaceae bacterium]